jgi:hypothetical protein
MRKQNRPLDTSETRTIIQSKIEQMSVRQLLQRDSLVLQGYTQEEAIKMVLEVTNGKSQIGV